MGTLVKFSTMFSLLILAASVGFPKFVVPNLPDLTVKTRRISGDGTSQLSALYLKGARQRTETVSENPARAHAMNWTVIRQCDEKRLFNINERDKLYSSSEIEDWAERSKKARPVSLSRMSGAEVTVTIDSIDTGERRQTRQASSAWPAVDSSRALALRRLPVWKRRTAGTSTFRDSAVKTVVNWLCFPYRRHPHGSVSI